MHWYVRGVMMPRSGPGGFACECGGKFRKVIYDEWADGHLIRVRTCKVCKRRQTTTERPSGEPRDAKSIDRGFVTGSHEKIEPLPSQMSLPGLGSEAES